MDRNDAALEAGGGPAGAPSPSDRSSAFPKKMAWLLPVVEQGCCCDLRTCCQVQASLALVVTGINALKVMLKDLSSEKDELEEICSDTGRCFTFLRRDVLTLISLACNVTMAVAAALFLKGISENKPVLMVHYIRMWVVFAFFCLLATVAGLCALVDVAISGAGMGFMIFVAALSCALSLYCLICANSLHVKMNQDLEAHAVGPASVKRYGATEEDPLNGAVRLDEFSFE